jgi:hypothetical protein
MARKQSPPDSIAKQGMKTRAAFRGGPFLFLPVRCALQIATIGTSGGINHLVVAIPQWCAGGNGTVPKSGSRKGCVMSRRSGTPASGNAFPVGTTTVTCRATDDAENTGPASFPVTVTECTPPATGDGGPGEPSGALWIGVAGAVLLAGAPGGARGRSPCSRCASRRRGRPRLAARVLFVPVKRTVCHHHRFRVPNVTPGSAPCADARTKSGL